VAPLARENEIQPQNILVIADDLDLPVGKLRLRDNGSPGGHNGQKSLVQYLHTQDYPRLKIGIGKGDSNIDHGLSGFPPDDRATVDKAIQSAAKACEEIVAERWQEALQRVDEWNKTIE
jgi:PTH1 family peptidyl-tRNA hydrolase